MLIIIIIVLMAGFTVSISVIVLFLFIRVSITLRSVAIVIIRSDVVVIKGVVLQIGIARVNKVVVNWEEVLDIQRWLIVIIVIFVGMLYISILLICIS